MNMTLLARELRYNLKILIIFCVVLTLYTTMIISMFDAELGESLNAMQEIMPEIFAAVGMNSPGTTLLDFIINYLFGFLYKVFPMIFFIILVNRVLIRYIDRGTMSYLLATPSSRASIAITQTLAITINLLLMITYVSGLAILCSELMFKGDLDIERFLMVMAALFCLLFFLSGICFLSGCIFNDAGKAIGVGAGINILFVLMEMISQVGDKTESLKYINPLTLFDPAGIASGDSKSSLMFTALFAGGLITYGLGILIFRNKDLSI